MMKLELYNYKGDKTLEFNFNNPEIHYNKWIIIKATKQTLHLNDQNFLLYDDTIPTCAINTEDLSLTKAWIESLYKQNHLILLVCNKQQEYLKLFYGKNITFTENLDEFDFTHFMVDGKDVYLSQCPWIILSKNLQS